MSDMDNPENGTKIGSDETASSGESSASKNGSNGTPQQPDLTLVSLMETLKAENAELKDRNLRTMAEMENLRRRTERDKTEMAKYAVSDFARDVLTIGDNLRRAIEAVPKTAAANDATLSNLLEGIEVTERELLKALERQGIRRFDPKGEKFDPHVHNAMMRIETHEAAPDTIFQVIHAGYMISERVLRPADVIVAKAATGPAPEKPSPVPSFEPLMEPAVQEADVPPPPEPDNSSTSAEELGNVIKMMSGTRKGQGGGGEDGPASKIRRVNVTTSVLPQQQQQHHQQKRTSSMTKPIIGSDGED
jgi:molecular chaperone GrpE